MSNSTLADNWTLQDIASLFNDGMSEDRVLTIEINREEDSFDYGNIPGSIIQTQALFAFLNDLVLRDQIVVDEGFVGSWAGKNAWLDSVYREGIVRAFPFQKDFQKILEVRPTFEDKLCVTTDLLGAHAANVRSWDANNTVPDNYLSQVLWGGAGMLSRGFVYEHSYSPHPLRRRFFESTGVYQQKHDALSRVGSFVEKKRAAVKHSKFGEDSVSNLSLSIRPLVTRIIRESSKASDLVPVAMRIRQEYSELRSWIRQYQEALNHADPRNLDQFESLISSVSRHIDSHKEIRSDDAATFTAGFAVLKIAIKGNPVNYLMNQFGVRSSICDLVSAESRESDLRKFLGFFGHRSSKIGMAILEHYDRAGT